MPKRIYVGNLPFSATENDLKELFSEYGEVSSVNLVVDRQTNRSKGFAFVEMESGFDEAIEALHQTEMGGRTLNVNEARPKPPRDGGGFRRR
jgi:RNA recognition motif-containing protein